MGLLNRMIFFELVKVFLFTLTGLTGIFLIGLVIQQASQLGLSPAQTLQVIPLLVPITFPYTIPATTLFASCVVYGRLSNDNEVVAMKAAGVDTLTLLRPALLVGILTAGITAWLGYSVIPRCEQQVRTQVLEDTEEYLYSHLKREKRLRAPSVEYVVFVREVQGRRLLDVVIKKKKPPGRLENGQPAPFEYADVARAREAKLLVDLDEARLAIDPDRWVWADNRSSVESGGNEPMFIPLPDVLTGKQVKSRAASLEWQELYTRIGELEARRDELIGERDLARRKKEEASTPEMRAAMGLHEQNYTNLLADTNRNLRTHRYETYFRPALAFGCIVFAVIGCPVGLWANRADYLSTFVICFLPMALLYFTLLLAGGGLAREGKLPMPVGVWGANVVTGLLAVVLTFRLIRR